MWNVKVYLSIYELEKLRCNQCGVIFSVKHPESVILHAIVFDHSTKKLTKMSTVVKILIHVAIMDKGEHFLDRTDDVINVSGLRLGIKKI
jgi:acyl-coenzyme A synthetase/AMP-(fatty) acid ligase